MQEPVKSSPSKSPLVSIITPTYNHERFIAQCLESVLAQTYPRWEMLVVDDGSTDKTAAIVKRYQDPRLRYFYQEHKGPFRLGETYNFALRQSQGELIAILEGDDWWPPDKLVKMVPLFANPKVVLAHGASYWVVSLNNGRELSFRQRPLESFPRGVVENKPVGESLKAFLYQLNAPITAVTVMIRRLALEKIGGFIQEPYLPLVDFTTFLRLALEGEFAYIDAIAGFWRKHASSITSSFNHLILKGFGDAALGFIKENAPRLAAVGIDPQAATITVNNTAREKLRTIFDNMDSWAMIFLEAGDFRSARKIYLRYAPFIRTPRQAAVLLLGLGSTLVHYDLLSVARKSWGTLKRKLKVLT